MYLESVKEDLPSFENVILMDETAIHLEDLRYVTLNERGKRHFVLESIGFASMRVTAVLAVSATGRKLQPLLIYKKRQSQARLIRSVWAYGKGKR